MVSNWSTVGKLLGEENAGWKPYNNRNHSQSGFPANEKGTKGQNYDRNWNGDDGEIELGIMLIRRYDHKELNRKPEEEEEIEFQ